MVYVGSQLQATSDFLVDWSGTPTVYSYQWQTSTDQVGWASVGGATSSDYVVPQAGLAHYFRCQVTASNAGGSVSVFTDNVGPAAAGPVPVPVPVVQTGPVLISGTIPDRGLGPDNQFEVVVPGYFPA